MQAAVCIGLSATIVWRVHAAATASAARDEERPLLGETEGSAARAEPAKHALAVARLVRCAAIALIGGVVAGLVGLVRTWVKDSHIPDISMMDVHARSACGRSGHMR